MRLEVYSRRWKQNEVYEIERTPDGWRITGLGKGDSNQRGEPDLFAQFEHDCINYPADLGGYMWWLWKAADEQHLSDDEIQANLDALAEWVQTVERASPAGLWRGYK